MDVLLCPPVWGTPRRMDRPTFGPAIAGVAAGLGKRLMPWQQYVADVIGEYDPETGIPYYREFRVLVPRQSGKTTLQMAKAVHRCIGFGSRQIAVYTAQNRTEAAKKWREEFMPTLEHAPVYGSPDEDDRWYHERKSQGSEGITWRNNSLWGIGSTGEKSGHGPTLDEGTIDEAWARQDASVEQAMRPAMITRDAAQIGIWSTAGKADGSSPYLHAKVVDGRSRVDAGQDRRIAYFEWSMCSLGNEWGEDVDPSDPANWPGSMPALGYTISLDTVAADIEGMAADPDQGPDEVARAYGNLWRGRGRSKSPYNPVLWADLLDETSTPNGRPMWALDMDPDRQMACTGIAAWSSSLAAELAQLVDLADVPVAPAPRRHLELTDRRPGDDWVLDSLDAQAAARGVKGKNRHIVLEAGSPAAGFADRLTKRGWTVHILNAGQYATACGDMVDAIRDKTIVHIGQTEVDTAVAGAAKRKLLDRWALNRGSSGADIAPIVTLVIARFGHELWPVRRSTLGGAGARTNPEGAG